MRFLIKTLLAFLLSGSLFSQIYTEEKLEPVGELTPHQVAFTNLPKAQRDLFSKRINEALKLFQQQRIFECLETLHGVAQIFPDSSELYNLRGSCYVEMRSFDKAMADYKKALELNPNNKVIMFNVAEIYFVMKKFEKANQAFSETLEEIGSGNNSITRLIEFKILLGLISLDRIDEAKILAKKYDYLDDSPFYYYAKAALDFHAEDPTSAAQHLASARRIFRNPQVIVPWHDSLIEFGYLKSFYGEDNPQLEE